MNEITKHALLNLINELEIDITENLEAAELGGPFGEDWARDMISKRNFLKFLKAEYNKEAD